MSATNLTKIVQFRMTQRQWARADQAAKAAGLELSAFIRAAIAAACRVA